MNIAMLLERVSLNDGVSRTVLGLSREFVRWGHTVDIYAAVNRLPDGGRGILPDPHVRFHWLPSFRGSWRIWSLPLLALLPFVRTMTRTLLPATVRPVARSRSRQHDLIISHTLTIKQDFVHMHNDPQDVELRKLSAVPFTLDPPRLLTLRRSVRTFFERLRFRPGNYRGVIAYSQRSAGELRDTFGIPADRITVIPHGVDSEYFSPKLFPEQRTGLRRRLDIGLDEVVYLFLGDSWKGLEFAIKALGRLPEASRACLLASGPYRKEPFEALAARHGVRLLAGGVWDDVRSLYAISDVLIHPTPLDTFGLVALESMSMRLPVITTRFCGMSELLRHGENGFVVDAADDVDGLAAAATALLDADRRVNMGAKAREFAKTRTWEAAARQHLAAYTRALEDAERPVPAPGVEA